MRVWTALAAKEIDEPALAAAVEGYLAKSADPWRAFALRYWIATNAQAQSREPGAQPALMLARRAQLETLINRHGAAPAATVN